MAMATSSSSGNPRPSLTHCHKRLSPSHQSLLPHGTPASPPPPDSPLSPHTRLSPSHPLLLPTSAPPPFTRLFPAPGASLTPASHAHTLSHAHRISPQLLAPALPVQISPPVSPLTPLPTSRVLPLPLSSPPSYVARCNPRPLPTLPHRRAADSLSTAQKLFEELGEKAHMQLMMRRLGSLNLAAALQVNTISLSTSITLLVSEANTSH